MATKELTYGKPLNLILAFMFPIFIGNIFQQCYNLVDALIVGRTIGIKALGAVGACAPLIFFFISFIFSSTQGFTVVLAQKFGARDYKNVRKSLSTSLVLSAILTFALTALSAPFSYQFLKLLNTPTDIIDLATTYLFIMFIGFFATVFYNLASNVIRALGDSKTPLYFLIFASFLNVFLDLIFIIKFHWGIAGAGWATVLSQLIATILSVLFMFWKFPILRLKKEDWKLEKDFVLEHINIGIPMGVQMSILTIGIIVLQFVLNGLGSIAVAAYTTAMRIEQLFTQSLVALGATIATYTAQNFGANKFGRIKQGAKISVTIAFGICIFSILILAFFSNEFISMFMSEKNSEILLLGSEYLHITMIFLIFLGFLLIFRNILQGMGEVVAPLLSGFAELIMRAIFAVALGNYFGFTGICFATPAAWISATIVLFLGYKINLKNRLYKVKQRKKV